MQIFFSCEHGGNRIPLKYRPIFAGQEELLKTHFGYDIGILPFAEFLAKNFNTRLIAADVSRLLVDLNRSRGNRTLFSRFTKPLSAADKAHILARYYEPYRNAVKNLVADIIAGGRQVLHVSVHSFTPVLNGRQRTADIGLLYDPQRPAEKSFCLSWQKQFTLIAPDLRVRRNYPYKGTADALVTFLRSQFPAGAYLGIELEINQLHPGTGGAAWCLMQKQVVKTLQASLQNIAKSI